MIMHMINRLLKILILPAYKTTRISYLLGKKIIRVITRTMKELTQLSHIITPIIYLKNVTLITHRQSG